MEDACAVTFGADKCMKRPKTVFFKNNSQLTLKSNNARVAAEPEGLIQCTAQVVTGHDPKLVSSARIPHNRSP